MCATARIGGIHGSGNLAPRQRPGLRDARRSGIFATFPKLAQRPDTGRTP